MSFSLAVDKSLKVDNANSLLDFVSFVEIEMLSLSLADHRMEVIRISLE
jgi:hypothetical protein